MHTRKEIIINQGENKDKIVDYLKEEYKQLKRELFDIQTQDAHIKEEKNKLVKKTKKLKIDREVEKLFISEKNIYPEYYAWWDINNEEVIKYKYKL